MDRVPPEAQILYADDTLIVADKPAGLLAVPGRGADKQDCLITRVRQRYPDALVVHRLDMATSGLLLMARSPAAQRALGDAFAQRRVGKRYEAVVHGCPRATGDAALAPWTLIDLPIHQHWPDRPRRSVAPGLGKPSQTRWQLLGPAGPRRTRLALEPLSGRTHQLRVHLQAIGHPIVGDALYGLPEDATQDRLLLHASVLELVHPGSGAPLRFVSPVPF